MATHIALLVLIFIIASYFIYRPWTTNIFTNYAYFDYNGTAPMRKCAQLALNSSLYLGNASAIYATAAKQILAQTANNIKAWAGCDPNWQIIFTSGASESITTILKGFSGRTICSAAEHGVTLANVSPPYLPVNPDSTIDQAAISLTAGDLLTVMSANNETGAITDIPAIYRLVQARLALMHVDAVQTFGKFPNIARYCDAFSASAHKFGGPTGVGILAISPKISIQPLIPGKQQHGLRGGTENVAAIASMNAALLELASQPNINQQLAAKRAWLNSQLSTIYPIASPQVFQSPLTAQPRQIFYVPLLPQTTESLPNTLSFSIVFTGNEQFCNIIFRDQLLKRKCIIGIGSACNTGVQAPNHVLVAMGVPQIVRRGMVRVSFGEQTTWSECRLLVGEMCAAISEQFG